jgi:hypothetical protein
MKGVSAAMEELGFAEREEEGIVELEGLGTVERFV